MFSPKNPRDLCKSSSNQTWANDAKLNTGVRMIASSKRHAPCCGLHPIQPDLQYLSTSPTSRAARGSNPGPTDRGRAAEPSYLVDRHSAFRVRCGCLAGFAPRSGRWAGGRGLVLENDSESGGGGRPVGQTRACRPGGKPPSDRLVRAGRSLE